MLATLPVRSRASTIGWVGLGAMGHHMAINLFTKTYQAHHDAASSSRTHRIDTARDTTDIPGFAICEQDDNRAEAFLRDLRNRGGSELANRVERVSDGSGMAKAASKIITMLPSTPQVESVYLDPSNGILAGVNRLPASTPPTGRDPEETPSEPDIKRPHTVLIDQTTLDPTAASRIATTIHESTQGRALMLDAPVSGGIVAAESGSLTIMLGSPSLLASSIAIPLLRRMAREGGVVECGGTGSGVGVKVCNNLILAINQIALAEGLALGRSLGIDPLLLHNVVNTSSGQSWSSRVNTPLAEVSNSPGSRSFSGGFQSRLMLKDVGLALTAAHAHDLPTPLTWAAKSVYESVCSEGEGEWATKDFSVVFEWLKKKQAEGVERGWKDGGPGA